MPPTFLIFLAFTAWIAIACFVWVAALVMLVSAKTRRFSKPLAFAMAWTLPFVASYQILAAFPVSVVLLSGWAFWKLLEPGSSSVTTNPMVIAVSICEMLFTFGLTLLASLAGLYDGWRTGWRWGQGQALRGAIAEAPIYGQVTGRVRALAAKRNRTQS